MCIDSIPAIRARAAKSLEPEHGSNDALDRHGDLLDSVVEILLLTQLDVNARVVTNALDAGGVGGALVDGDLFRHAVQVDGAFEELPRVRHVTVSAKQEVDRAAGAVDGPVQVLPLAKSLMYVSSIRQLVPTGRLRRRNTAASTGRILIDQRCTVT